MSPVLQTTIPAPTSSGSSWMASMSARPSRRIRHLGRDVVDGDGAHVQQLRVDPGQVIPDEIVQLGREFDARRPAPDNGKVKQLPPLRVTRRGQAGRLKGLQDLQPDGARVAHVAQEVRVLPDAFDAERLAVGADGDDQLVVPDLQHVSLDLGLVRRGAHVPALVCFDANDLVLEVDARSPCLVELVQAETTDRLDHGAEFQRPHRGRCQQRCEDKVRPRRYEDPFRLGA
ncbi:hypothetical protein E4U54_006268 [Claviceps lovelessii]|nr:hypothetical protein E4U54_006268 [Claviceps lovelessii]